MIRNCAIRKIRRPRGHRILGRGRALKRIAVRSGGHSLEGFVDRPEVQLILDLGEMDAVYFDARHRAFAIEAGATLGHVYRSLYLGWGVTIPGGLCPAVGLRGHVAGGGYGPLSRQYGTTVDHLYGVEASASSGVKRCTHR